MGKVDLDKLGQPGGKTNVQLRLPLQLLDLVSQELQRLQSEESEKQQSDAVNLTSKRLCKGLKELLAQVSDQPLEEVSEKPVEGAIGDGSTVLPKTRNEVEADSCREKQEVDRRSCSRGSKNSSGSESGASDIFLEKPSNVKVPEVDCKESREPKAPKASGTQLAVIPSIASEYKSTSSAVSKSDPFSNRLVSKKPKHNLRAPTWSSSEYSEGAKDRRIESAAIKMREQLVNIFGELDHEGKGVIDSSTLQRELATIGVTQARSAKLLKVADANKDGHIDVHEWCEAIESMPEEIKKIGAMVLERKLCDEHIVEDEGPREPFMMHPNCRLRLLWDFVLAILLVYVAVVVPFTASFNLVGGTANFFKPVDMICDCLFMFDVVVNFRTGYINGHNQLELGWRSVARRYLRTWFILDFASSFPLDWLTNGKGRLEPVKLLKVSKVMRVFKLMQLGGRIRNINCIQDLIDTFHLRMVLRRGNVIFKMALLCHWMACFMQVSGPGYLAGYQDVSHNAGSQYLAALYWAMTTMTTVGYGDITPGSDGERGYAILAMVVGGSFYGYVVGSICAIVANNDLNANMYYERMDLIQAWLEHHQFPKQLRRKLCKFFAIHLVERSTINSSEIVNDLTPDLQKECVEWLVHSDVRHSPLFDGVSTSELGYMVHILKKMTFEKGTNIVQAGDIGTALHIIIKGSAVMEREQEDGGFPEISVLSAGDSFGEAIVLGIEEKYDATVKAVSEVSMFLVPEAGFIDCWANMPVVVEKLHANFKSLEDSGAVRRSIVVSPETVEKAVRSQHSGEKQAVLAVSRSGSSLSASASPSSGFGYRSSSRARSFNGAREPRPGGHVGQHCRRR